MPPHAVHDRRMSAVPTGYFAHGSPTPADPIRRVTVITRGTGALPRTLALAPASGSPLSRRIGKNGSSPSAQVEDQDARRSARLARRRSLGPSRRSVVTCSCAMTGQSRPQLRQHHVSATARPWIVVSRPTEPRVAQKRHCGGTANRTEVLLMGTGVGGYDTGAPRRLLYGRSLTAPDRPVRAPIGRPRGSLA
jgi:hypothetical protein